MVKKRRHAAARRRRSAALVSEHAMRSAASSGVAVRKLVASRVAWRVAAGISSNLKGSGFVPAAQHLQDDFPLNLVGLPPWTDMTEVKCWPLAAMIRGKTSPSSSSAPLAQQVGARVRAAQLRPAARETHARQPESLTSGGSPCRSERVGGPAQYSAAHLSMVPMRLSLGDTGAVWSRQPACASQRPHAIFNLLRTTFGVFVLPARQLATHSRKERR